MGVVRWQSAIDFVVLAVGLYFLLRWSREARALRLAVGILALRVGALLAQQLGLVITGWVLDAATVVVLLALVVVFQPELRRALMRLDLPGRGIEAHRTSVAAAVSAAAWSLAQRRCGALIVFVQRDAIAELVTSGIRLDGRVSTEILEAIFQKDTPVHDGAAIVEGDLVARVGAILPLTQRTPIPGGYGTRHRAGMGLAERCDALVIVVSEERGEVTLMYGDQTQRMRSEAELLSSLNARLGMPVRAGERSLRNLRPATFALPSAALALSAAVWGLTFLFPGTSVRVRSVPVEFTNVPPGLTVASQSTDTVDVWLQGSDFVFESVNLEAVVAQCDLTGARDGANAIRIAPDALRLPPGLRVTGIAPRQVTVRLAPTLAPSKH